MTDGDQREAAAWPQPHPSPPLPPARGSGVPGAPPSRAPYVAGAVAALVALVVVVLLVVVLTGDDEPEGSPAGRGPSTAASEPAPDPSTSASTQPAAGATCWDATTAGSVDACSTPTGAAGLAWVFPVMADARCGTPSAAGGDGVVTRVLCLYRFADGTRAQLGFFEWGSVEQGVVFYDGQGLDRSASADYVTWSGGSGGQAKTATMYAAAPYSVSITYPSSADPGSDELLRLAPRPPGELKGVPDH